ncbi:acetyl-CoA C-acetyltransferase [Microbispora sp. H10836]|uniref:acetyl-CoA C-acetyltransferase n=1 Tax=Microbispora sp. H10836 TaxID=2729106 RepID=UPI00147536B0|nr:acetyl-CoA C-acetyltransferase [Microbispora sp. H10836]
MTEAVIVAAARTPIGRAHKGSLTGVRPDDLAAHAVRAAISTLGLGDDLVVDDLLLGCGLPGGEAGYNMARVVAELSGLRNVPSATVNRYCASSLQTTRMAFHAIRAGEGHTFVSAGVESVSRTLTGNPDGAPGTQNPVFARARERTAARSMSNDPWEDPARLELASDVYISMGETAENVASAYDVSRADQDAYAALSQERTQVAIEQGHWAREITPIELPDGTRVVDDDSPRAGVTVESLAGLRPVFRESGTVTAGNSCPLNDGAAALVVMSAVRARALGLTPLARIVSTAVSGLSPEIMGMGPVEASRKALDLAGLTMADMDLVEINEAFAAQVLACARELKVDLDRLNVHGGAIAVGHPFGMTGARITGTLVNALRARDGRLGLETMCVGGGQGMAMVLERLT